MASPQPLDAKPLSVCRNGFNDVVDAVRGIRHGPDDARAPQAGCAAIAELDEMAQVSHRRVGAIAVGFVDHEDIGHLENAGLDRLNAVAHPGGHQHECGVGETRHLHFALAHPDRFEQDDVKARRVQDAQGLGVARDTPPR